MVTESLRLKHRQTLIPVHVHAVGYSQHLKSESSSPVPCICSSEMLMFANFALHDDGQGVTLLELTLISWPAVGLLICCQWKSVGFFRWHPSLQGSVKLWVYGVLSLLPCCYPSGKTGTCIHRKGRAHFDVCLSAFCKLWTTVHIVHAGLCHHRLSVGNRGEYGESLSCTFIIWDLSFSHWGWDHHPTKSVPGVPATFYH